jgi:hypothetical protein
MHPENMPYYHGPRFQATASLPNKPDKLHIQTLLTNIIVHPDVGHTHLSHVPVKFGRLSDNVSIPKLGARALLNSKFAWYARQVIGFNWMVYSFTNGHCSSMIATRNQPFQIALPCNPYESGQALFQKFVPDACIFSSGNNLLNHVRELGQTLVISSFLINSYRFCTSNITTSFWMLQLSIITQLCLKHSLSTIVAMVIPDHDCHAVSAFVQSLTPTHWKVTSWVVYYPNIGKSIADFCTIITAIHTSCAGTVDPIELKTPPLMPSWLLGSFLWEPLNRPKRSVCLSCYDSRFNKDSSPMMVVTEHCPASELGCFSIFILYQLHRDNSDSLILAGSSVLSHGSLFLPIESCPNQNLFQNYFGIQFDHDGSSYICSISTFKFA